MKIIYEEVMTAKKKMKEDKGIECKRVLPWIGQSEDFSEEFILNKSE